MGLILKLLKQLIVYFEPRDTPKLNREWDTIQYYIRDLNSVKPNGTYTIMSDDNGELYTVRIDRCTSKNVYIQEIFTGTYQETKSFLMGCTFMYIEHEIFLKST